MESKSDTLPPAAMLRQLVAGKFVTQALAAAAELNVAEQLADGARSSSTARQTGCDPW